MKPVLLDTGVIVASLDRSEKCHREVVAAVTALHAPLITCEAVIAESCYLLRGLPGAAETVVENVAAGVFQVPFQLSSAAKEVLRILGKYRDSHIDFANACLVHLANQFRTGEILTLDRDFEVYRWGRNNPFQNLIAR